MKKFKISLSTSIEGTILVALLVATAVVLAAAWGGAMKLKNTVAENASIMHVDTSALTEVEHLRTLADSQFQNSRAYFLMGSKSIYDKQAAEKTKFAADLAAFAKKHPSKESDDVVKKITDLTAQEAELFHQGEEFRAKATESKIVGQFYQSKTNSLLAQIHESLDKIVKAQDAKLAEARTSAAQAGTNAQSMIPKEMSALTTAITIIAALFALLVIRVVASRAKVLRQRERLVQEARNATISRDEVISAYTQDFKAPLEALGEYAGQMSNKDDAEFVKSTITEMEATMADIYDQTKASTGGLFLRLEQLPVADILDDAQSFLQPLARQKDINLTFDQVNPSVLAYVDRERVMRVLSNLVGNAIKFSPKHSKVNIKIKADAQWVNISVLDSGPRIPDAQLPAIFENYWQARRSAEQGAGVGLTVVKTIIEAHGGIVKVEHNLQGGNTFTFSLSRRRPANVQLKKPQSAGVRKVARPDFDNVLNEGPAH